MSSHFVVWKERIVAAEDAETQRALLTEIARWRAANLMDVPAQRQGAYAMALLHTHLNDRDRALREAQSLVSLCKTPPEATPGELEEAIGLLGSLGGTSPAARPTRKPPARDVHRERAPRSERGEAPRRGSAARSDDRPDPVALAASGKYDRALDAITGRGAGADLLRTWILLARALRRIDVVQQATELKDLEANLRRRFTERQDARAEPTSRADTRRDEPRRDEPEVISEVDRPLADLLGGPVPRKRDPRMRALERHADAHPDQIDVLASTALRHQVAVAGPRKPAPWLVGIVGRAMATTDAEQTRAALAELEGAFAVTAYGEPPFSMLVDVLRAAGAEGWQMVSLRRGVMARLEPPDRVMWTLRLHRAGADAMVVAAPPSEAAYDGGSAEQLATRITELSPHAVLVAAGAGNADLRSAAAERGVQVVEPGEVVAALQSVPVSAPAERTPAASVEAERGPGPGRRLHEAILREGEPDHAELVAILTEMGRMNRAFGVVRPLLAEMEPAEADARALALVRAMDEVVPETVRLGEALSILVRAAARGVEGADALFARPRFADDGVGAVVSIARALSAAGFEVERVLRGTTRRERREHPALDTLAGAADGLWRLVVRRGEVEGEAWYVSNLPPEGRAVVPQLLLQEAKRLVVLPVEPELLRWYAEAGGPEAIGWTGDEADAVVAAAQSW